jgi:very-short-patch-repair endonuclease
MRGLHDPENILAWQIACSGLPAPTREHRFHPTRRWRADYCWVSAMLIVEVDGGTWAQGRHTRGAGYAADCVKQAEAVCLGFSYMRFTSDQIEDGTALRYIQMYLQRYDMVSEGGGDG